MSRAGARFRVAGLGDRHCLAVAAVLAAVTSTACRPEPLPPPDVIARIGGEPVRYPAFESYVRENAGEAEGEVHPAVMPVLFDRFLDERLLARAAADTGAAPAGTPAREAIEILLAGVPFDEPSAAEIEAYYAAHAAEFARPERVRLRQIFVTDRAAAERAAADLANGRPFARVARGTSRDPAAERGGDQGELALEDLPTALAEVVFKLDPGETSGIVQADYGFHIFQVVERLPAATLPLEAVAGDIRAALLRHRQDRQLAALVTEARTRYNLEIYAHNLPFPYTGPSPPSSPSPDPTERR